MHLCVMKELERMNRVCAVASGRDRCNRVRACSYRRCVYIRRIGVLIEAEGTVVPETL